MENLDVRLACKFFLSRFSVLINYTMWFSKLFPAFFIVQVFQGPGFSRSRFFWVQVFQGRGSGSGSRVWVQVLEVALTKFKKFTGKHLSIFFNKVADRPEDCNSIKKEALAQLFSCEFCKISKNTFFHRTPLVAASAIGLTLVLKKEK